jgi:hypothetical protein
MGQDGRQTEEATIATMRSMMFDWLEQEIRTIRTRRFHVVDGAADPALRAAVEGSEAPVPQSYKEFILQFGNAKLYKKHGYYIVGVLAGPVEEQSPDGENLYRIGHYQSSNAYFKSMPLRGEEEAPIFEGHGGRLVQVADGFDIWLTKRCKSARGKYSKQQWAQIVAGPPPFTPEENRIVEARRQFTCRLTYVTPEGRLLLEVHNGSGMVLPYLSIGVQWKNNSLQGGIWLPVSNIRPGQTAVVDHDAYSTQAATEGVDLFLLPDPEPEDRERYWEFKALKL